VRVDVFELLVRHPAGFVQIRNVFQLLRAVERRHELVVGDVELAPR